MTLRQKYEFIRDVMNFDDIPLNRQKKLNIVKETKREIRRLMTPLNTDPFEETYHYRDNNYDSYYIKEFFDSAFTEKDKEEFIEDQWRRIYSPYDCTGLAFTTSIHICNFKEPNSFGAMSCVYHFLSYDV